MKYFGIPVFVFLTSFVFCDGIHSLQCSIDCACISATAFPIDKIRSDKMLQSFSKRLAFVLGKVGLHSHAISVNRCYNARYEDIIYTYYYASLIPRRLYLREWKVRSHGEL